MVRSKSGFGSLRAASPRNLSAFRLRIQKFWLRVNFRSPNWRDFTACLHIWSATWIKPPPGDRGLNSKTWAFSSIPSNPTLIGGSTALSAGWSKSQNRASFTPSITSTGCCAVIQQAGHHLCKSWSIPGFGPLTRFEGSITCRRCPEVMWRHGSRRTCPLPISEQTKSPAMPGLNFYGGYDA